RISLGGGLYVTARAIGIEREGQRAAVAVRPERIRLSSDGRDGDNRLRATIGGRIYLGDHLRLLGTLENGQALTVKVGPEGPAGAGEPVMVSWAPADCRAFPVALAGGNGSGDGETQQQRRIT